VLKFKRKFRRQKVKDVTRNSCVAIACWVFSRSRNRRRGRHIAESRNSLMVCAIVVHDRERLLYDVSLLPFIVACLIRRQRYFICIILCITLLWFLSPSYVINVFERVVVSRACWWSTVLFTVFYYCIVLYLVLPAACPRFKIAFAFSLPCRAWRVIYAVSGFNTYWRYILLLRCLFV